MRNAVALAAILTCSPALAQEPSSRARTGEGRQRFELSTGVDFQRGDFGTKTDIETMTIPLAISASKGRVRVNAQSSWVRVTAPANVIAPTGPLGLPILIDPNQPSTVETRQGFGDLRVGAAYDLPVAGLIASARTAVKLPTASARKGLGTGQTDFSVGVDIAKPLGAITPFASVTYTMPGDPQGFELRNSFSGQAGAALRLSKSTTAQLGYAYAQSLAESASDDQRVIAGLNSGVGKTLSLGVYGSGGLSSGAPAVGGGVSLGLKLGQ